MPSASHGTLYRLLFAPRSWLAAWAWVSVLVLLLDQGTKAWARATLPLNEPPAEFITGSLFLVFNAAGPMSLGQSLPEAIRAPLFAVAPLLVLLGGFAWLNSRRAATLTDGMRVGVGLVLTAGLSNWLDRLWLPGVTDFIVIGPACINVADWVAMQAAASVVALTALRTFRNLMASRREASAST